MGRLKLALVLAGLVVAMVFFAPSAAFATTVHDGVPGLELCGSLPPSQCDLGPIDAHFTDYKNVCSDDDCFFVSAADWEKVAAGVTPTATTLDIDYKAAGQTYSGGLSAPDLWTYWKSSGIDGFYLATETLVSRSESSVESIVEEHRAVFAEGVAPPHSLIGLTEVDARTFVMIADGYTPKGPLVVYQSKTIQMTWAQWNAQVRTVWEVAASRTPPTVTTPPTSKNVPTAMLSLSANSLASAGGTVTLTYSSENATNCTLTSSPSIWTTATEPVACEGTYEDTVAPSTTAQEWTFTFTASNEESQSAVSTQTLVESAPAATTPQFENPSENWSGYVVPSSSALITGTSGDWTVPTLNCVDTSNSYVSIWVGIGGEEWNATSSSGALLQTGVTSDCADGVQQNVGWWYLDPSSAAGEINFVDFPVTTGDQMEASVFETTTGAWQTEVTDINTGLTAAMITGEYWGVGETAADTIDHQGSSSEISYSGGYTAEWIVEDPGVSTAPGTYYPFADFGSVTFTNMRASFSSWYLTPSEEWGIVQDGVTLAAPTSTTSDGFTDTYTGP